ncbi:MAG: hypothetical protein JNK92_02505 [Dechloromonas sp.]|nr:hypothetical protein [Dechloromonas sp.]
MKKFIALFALLACGVGSAVGACGAPYLSGTAITSLLTGKIARSPANCTTNCQWQELHQAGGVLIEQHSGTAADPAETVGTWRVQSTGPGNNTITHTYNGGGGAYTYQVKNNGATYSFCGPNGEFTFSVH